MLWGKQLPSSLNKEDDKLQVGQRVKEGPSGIAEWDEHP